MKKLLLTFLIIHFTFLISNAQVNLVPNPSFEDTVACPYQAGDINKALGWNTFCGSPDYLNTCANPSIFGVPSNFGGYQIPSSGDAYAGFLSYIGSIPNFREFPSSILSTSLTIGQKYYVSFKVALSLGTFTPSNLATNKIGATFTTGFYTCNSLVTNNPAVFTDSIIIDSLNWTKITGSFIADSSYSHIVIGNFFDDFNTDTVSFFANSQNNAYYYLDDVCVSTDSAFAYNYVYNTSIPEMTSQNQITFFPNPVIENLNIKNSFNEPIDIYIYNVFGELIYSVKNINHKTLSVNLPHTQKGLLLVNIKSQSQSINYKLLKL